MATSPSNRSVSQAPQSLRKVRFPSLRKELLRLESGRLFAGVFGWRALATVRKVLAIARAIKPEIPRGPALTVALCPPCHAQTDAPYARPPGHHPARRWASRSRSPEGLISGAIRA